MNKYLEDLSLSVHELKKNSCHLFFSHRMFPKRKFINFKYYLVQQIQSIILHSWFCIWSFLFRHLHLYFKCLQSVLNQYQSMPHQTNLNTFYIHTCSLHHYHWFSKYFQQTQSKNLIEIQKTESLMSWTALVSIILANHTSSRHRQTCR